MPPCHPEPIRAPGHPEPGRHAGRGRPHPPGLRRRRHRGRGGAAHRGRLAGHRRRRELGRHRRHAHRRRRRRERSVHRSGPAPSRYGRRVDDRSPARHHGRRRRVLVPRRAGRLDRLPGEVRRRCRRPDGTGRRAPAGAAARHPVLAAESLARGVRPAAWIGRSRPSRRHRRHRPQGVRRVAAVSHRHARRLFAVLAGLDSGGVRLLPTPRAPGCGCGPRCRRLGLPAGHRQPAQQARRADAVRPLHRHRAPRVPALLLRERRAGEGLRRGARQAGLPHAAGPLPYLRQAQARGRRPRRLRHVLPAQGRDRDPRDQPARADPPGRAARVLARLRADAQPARALALRARCRSARGCTTCADRPGLARSDGGTVHSGPASTDRPWGPP